MGKLSDQRFMKLREGCEQEQAELKQSVEQLHILLDSTAEEAGNVQNFLKIVRKYTEPTDLTPAMFYEFVDKIIVHECDKSSGHRVQQIDVYYNFIGEIDLFPEYSRTIKGRKRAAA